MTPGATPIDLVLSRAEAHRLRPTGPNRWRMAGICHDGKNPSSVSIGIGNNGAVLLRCWAGCSVDQTAHALGLDLADLFPPHKSQARPLQKRRLISAGQALDLLHDEAQLVALCAANIAWGLPLTDDDKARCLVAAGRVAYLHDEVLA
jgi:hypothetical protein